MPAGARVLIDAYAVLGVTPGAALSDIKRSYKKLAREFHPDVNHAPGAEDRFKEISAAWDLLKDDDRRATYDRRRSPARPAAKASPPRPPAARPPPRAPEPPPPAPQPPPPQTSPAEDRKADIFVKVELTYAEAIQSAVKTIHFRRRQLCRICRGVETPKKPCRACWGAGFEDIPSTYEWKVAGVASGEPIVIPGMGDRVGDKVGNLRLSIGFLKMLGVTRDGLDFQVLKRVPRELLTHGGPTTVDGPAGAFLIQIPPNSKSGLVVRVRDAGLPEGNRRGAVYVTVRELVR